MIEVRFDSDRLKKIPNDIGHHAEVTNVMRGLGVPVLGALMLRGVSEGTLTMHTEPDIDTDEWVFRWYQPREWENFMSGRLPSRPRKVIGQGKGEGYTWQSIGFELITINLPVEDDGEI